MNLNGFAACLKANGDIAGVAGALASDMPPGPDADMMPMLAEALLNPDLAFPDTPRSTPLATEYARNLMVLRDLVNWRRYRVRPHRARRVISSPVEFDALATKQLLVDWSPVVQLTHAALSLVRPTKRAAVVVSMRDEGISILEWVAHYRAVGFEGIFVYSNDNMDGSPALLRQLAAHGIITFIENDTSSVVSPQRKGFAHSLHFLPELRDYEWVFYADADEFLVPAETFDFRIPPVLSAVSENFLYRQPSAIIYHWRWFISNYSFARTDGILLERFDHAVPSKSFKSLVRISDVLSMREIHFPDVAAENYFVDPDLNIIPASIDVNKTGIWKFAGNGYKGGQLNHYWCKSFEEFALKQWRGRGDQSRVANEDAFKRGTRLFFTWNDRVRRGSAAPAPPRLMERVHAELAMLQGLDGVAELDARMRQGFPDLLMTIVGARNLREIYEEFAISTSLTDGTGQALVGDHGGAPFEKVLHHLHETLRPTNYFEIGTRAGVSLALARCSSIAVDPEFRLECDVLMGKSACHMFQQSSDEFFAVHSPLRILGCPIDLALLNGAQSFEPLLRDFTNTEPHCRRGSVILLRHCLPTNVHVGRREAGDRTYAGRLPHEEWWAGDVWKMLLILKQFRPDLTISCFDSPPAGLVVITNLDPSSTRLRDEYDRIVREFAGLDLMEYSVARLFDEAGLQPTDALWSATNAEILQTV